MNVRAKFRVVEVSKSTDITGSGECSKIRLQAVYGAGNDDANKEWSKWTPSGELSMQITNPAAVDALKLGVCYYLDISPAE